MSQSPKTIVKHPVLEPASDFYRLRRDGIGFIEQMSSRLWTDYNNHDPGITTLEVLCYAITDLAYRIGWDIKDILAPETLSTDPAMPYPDQAFFTAREILTINPVTTDDFRRLLIDLQQIRNAWVECSCKTSYYAWCDKGQLRLSCQNPLDVSPSTVKKVSSLGLYEVSLELEADPEQGDLNDRKVEYSSIFHDADGAHSTIMELRFPSVNLADGELWRLFLDGAESTDDGLLHVTLSRLGATKTYNVFSESKEESRDSYLRNHWRTVFYLDFTIDFTHILADKSQKKETLHINHATLRVYSDVSVKTAMTTEVLKTILENKRSDGFVQRYRRKAKAAQAAVQSAKLALLSHRNLDEDYCVVTVVGIEEVAVCADVEVQPDADIEWVQARIWFEIEQYFNPSIRFYTLQELQEAGEAVEEIFNGPELNCGFIKADDLENASLKTELRVSDIINRLMDIEGVIAVNRMLLTKYDAEGNVVKGAADPERNGAAPTFDPNKTSASWVLSVSKQHQPRLYRNASRFLFYKNGLPFLPRMDEVFDTLNQLRGEAERPKLNSVDNDLSIPTGRYRERDDYYPVQYSLPLVYGTGPEGVPAHASALRRAQAKQMKSYLMVFEQMLANAVAQLAHTADLFSLDPDIRQTYFVKMFSEKLIQGFDEIKGDNYTEEALEGITETLPEFFQRRNRFLDHLLARFGEQFSEYALLLNTVYGKQVALDRLIDDKISFLKAYPVISHDRAKAFDYHHGLFLQENQSCIKKRISLLLGYPDLTFFFTGTHPAYGPGYTVPFELKDKNNKIWLKGKITVPALTPEEAETDAFRELLVRMYQPHSYHIVHKHTTGLFQLAFKDKTRKLNSAYPVLFSKKADAEELQKELQAWSANERLIVVEHLLLRPKFPGDALYPACTEAGYITCGDEDPYSFRLTFVMPGWMTVYTNNLELRRFAERTIREETPAHLLGKTCWVGNNDGQFDRFEQAWNHWLTVNSTFDWTEERLQERVEWILASSLTTTASENSVCQCATDILAAYGMQFFRWMEERVMAGIVFDKFDETTPFIPSAVSIPHELIEDEATNKGTAQSIKNFLDSRYSTYKEVSYRLWNVVNLLSKLRNIYPVATLHDCDAGSDINPVRLDNTALGGSSLSSSSETT